MRKKRPVLYEVVSRSRRTRSWTASPPKSPEPEPITPVMETAPPVETHEVEESAPRSMQIAGGRVYLALGWPQLLVLGVILLVIVVASYQVGRRSMMPASSSDASFESTLAEQPGDGQPVSPRSEVPRTGRTARRTATPTLPPRHQATVARAEPVVEEPAAPVEAFAFEEGRHYVVVQHFGKSRRLVAEQARDFLIERGIACVVREARRDLELVVTQPFDDPNGARTLQQTIRGVGAEFNRIGGYNFKDCYARRF